jgi:hypothetical protein
MKGGFNWLVESSDEEETEAEFRRQLARVEADEVKPPPTVTKQYLDVSRRRTLPRGTSTSGLATTDGSSNVSTVHLSLASSSAGTAEISVGRGNVQDGDSAIPQARTGALESPVLALPPPRAKRRWQRADNQLQSYFTSLMASDQLAEPNLRVRRNISSREHRYKERIRRTSTTADKRAGEHAGEHAGAAAALSPVRNSAPKSRPPVHVRPVHKDPTVLGPPIRMGGQHANTSSGKTRARRTRGNGRRGREDGVHALRQPPSPLKYKAVGAARNQRLELPPI